MCDTEITQARETQDFGGWSQLQPGVFDFVI